MIQQAVLDVVARLHTSTAKQSRKSDDRKTRKCFRSVKYCDEPKKRTQRPSNSSRSKSMTSSSNSFLRFARQPIAVDAFLFDEFGHRGRRRYASALDRCGRSAAVGALRSEPPRSERCGRSRRVGAQDWGCTWAATDRARAIAVVGAAVRRRLFGCKIGRAQAVRTGKPRANLNPPALRARPWGVVLTSIDSEPRRASRVFAVLAPSPLYPTFDSAARSAHVFAVFNS